MHGLNFERVIILLFGVIILVTSQGWYREYTKRKEVVITHYVEKKPSLTRLEMCFKEYDTPQCHADKTKRKAEAYEKDKGLLK